MNLLKPLLLIAIVAVLGQGLASLDQSATAKDIPAKPTKSIVVASDKATLQSKSITLTRGKPGQERPQYKQAKVQYPIVTSGPNASVLKQVAAAIGLKQVLGQSLEEIKTDFQQSSWLSSIRYDVNYNKKSILQLTYIRSGSGAYPSTDKSYGAVDLLTGKAIAATDLFAPEALEKVADQLDQVLQQQIQTAIVEKTKKYELGPEDLSSRLANKKFKVENLNNFVIGEQGITFVYEFGFPHVALALEPDGKLFLSYAELKPNLKPQGIGMRLGE